MGITLAKSAPAAAAGPARATGRTVRVGVTGHMDLGPETVRLVAEALRGHLRGLGADAAGLVGVSCLAPGADRIFARVLLDLGGRLEVILPSAGYRDQTDEDCAPSSFAALLRQADSVRAIEGPTATPHTYVAANDAMLASVDSLVAVWDGHRSAKPGGTAHVVEIARSRRMHVAVIWPPGARREHRGHGSG
ncbi:hypothetical protein KGA66_09285 [Actinocrinis puniceicyclus]|uniref:Uncharacterized protein n=1 Tax=Actinocrinis puniceicyclus TaxID=977794 RepID=A0A8J7WJ47_9ACTN|nr:hypothetical protein [Actinocrinis puniceicyclus]MBS2963238.1 hypothetical protein [Actinocrinis puniceicyclus]